MFVLDERQIQLDTPFEHSGTQYPANWLRLASPSEREAIGIIELPDYPMPDQRFYWVSGPNEDGTYTAIPKDLITLKATWSEQVRQTAWTLLNPSDWMIVRKQETGVEIPAEWTTYRTAVRLKVAEIIAAIDAAADVEALISTVSNIEWPIRS